MTEKTKWNGQGLPPEGTRCLYLTGGEWHHATVVAEDGDTRWVRLYLGDKGPYYITTDNPCYFHPLEED